MRPKSRQLQHNCTPWHSSNGVWLNIFVMIIIIIANFSAVKSSILGDIRDQAVLEFHQRKFFESQPCDLNKQVWPWNISSPSSSLINYCTFLFLGQHKNYKFSLREKSIKGFLRLNSRQVNDERKKNNFFLVHNSRNFTKLSFFNNTSRYYNSRRGSLSWIILSLLLIQIQWNKYEKTKKKKKLLRDANSRWIKTN